MATWIGGRSLATLAKDKNYHTKRCGRFHHPKKTEMIGNHLKTLSYQEPNSLQKKNKTKKKLFDLEFIGLRHLEMLLAFFR